MTNLGSSVGWGLAIACSLLAGALAAVLLRLPERVAATLTAFGGGILLAAIAFELVPDADAGGGTMLTAGGREAERDRLGHAVPAIRIARGELGVALLAGILLGNVVEAYGAAQPILVS